MALALVGAAMVVVWVGIVLAAAFWATKVPLQELQKQATAMSDRLRVMPIGELAASSERGWREVRADAPPRGWAAFDPVVGLPWAMGLARQWAPDATLTRIDVSRAASDGTVNLTGGPDDTVGYRFISPDRIASWVNDADVHAKVEASYGLLMTLAQQKVTASIQRGRPPASGAPALASTLPLSEVLARARANATFVDRPFYAGYLIQLPTEGWVWYFQTLSGRDALPRVRARDGRVYPYR